MQIILFATKRVIHKRWSATYRAVPFPGRREHPEKKLPHTWSSEIETDFRELHYSRK